MKLSKSCLTAAALATGIWFAAPIAWAESQVGGTDPSAFGITIDPNASGTKVSGPVTLSYDYTFSTQLCPTSGRFVNNLYAVATFTKGNVTQPFNANYKTFGNINPPLAACFDRQDNQVQFLALFITQIIIPQLFNCTPSACPGYAIKSIKNFLTTGVGAGYMEVELAVK